MKPVSANAEMKFVCRPPEVQANWRQHLNCEGRTGYAQEVHRRTVRKRNWPCYCTKEQVLRGLILA